MEDTVQDETTLKCLVMENSKKNTLLDLANEEIPVEFDMWLGKILEENVEVCVNNYQAKQKPSPMSNTVDPPQPGTPPPQETATNEEDKIKN